MSDKLMAALEQVREMPEITVGRVVDHTGRDSIIILCLISVIPFLQPIPLPGISTALGFVAALQGIGFVIWSRPVLTKKLREVKISHEKFELIFNAAAKINRITSKISTLKHSIVQTRLVHIVSGLCIIYSALFLSLPLPIPFSNSIPAFSIFLICVALLEDDLALLLCGISATVASVWMSILSYHLIMELVGELVLRYWPF